MENSIIEKEKIVLENLFKVFSNQKNKRDFYIDLEKYIQHIKSSSQLSKIVNSLEKEIRSNLEKITSENKKTRLKELVETDVSKQSIKKGKIDVTNISNRLIKEFEEERNKSLWGAWERLLWVYFAFSNEYPDYEFPKNKKLKKGDKIVSERTNEYLHFCFEFEEIVGYKIVNDEQRTPNLLNIINRCGNKRNDPNEIEFFRSYAKRIHFYFLNELEKLNTNKKDKRTDIYIDNYLIYKTLNKEPFYKIMSYVRKNILDYLLRDENRRVLRKELAIHIMKTSNPTEVQKMQISRDVRDINDHFKERLYFPIKEDEYSLIEPSKKKGYKMNNEKFNFIVNK